MHGDTDMWRRAQEARERIRAAIPPGKVTAVHTAEGHFYEVEGKTLPSVTGVLSMLKDESLTVWKVNRALAHVYANLARMGASDKDALDVLEEAKREPARIADDAGDIGTFIHAAREGYFADLARERFLPADSRAYADNGTGVPDTRAVSAMRALDAFVRERLYVPVLSEVMVYDDVLHVAGTLDDIGIVTSPTGKDGSGLCLLDVKSSNRIRDSYLVQVALYARMAVRLTGLKFSHVFILRLSKEDGTYEVLRIPAHKLRTVTSAAERIVKAWRAWEDVKDIFAGLTAKKRITL